MVSELFRALQRFLEVFRGFQRFSEVFRVFQRPSQRPSQSAIFLSELRVVLPLIVLPLKTPAISTFHWKTKGRFRKRVVLANVPSFRFSREGGNRVLVMGF